ncbi:hypothetical protein CLOP_g23222 [Closterium sp. NIES-67]|nr:hypothetical protein CLOP_g23222 [Closterium sp. NIES-67]
MRQLARIIGLSGRSCVTSAPAGASHAPAVSRATPSSIVTPNPTNHHGAAFSPFNLTCLRGISASSAAARPPGATVRASMENVETMTMSDAEIRALGAKKRPPGEYPGGPLHQQGRLSGWFKPELRPLYPLFAMVTLGLGLAVWTMARELGKDPKVMVNKTRRQQMLFEIDDPQTIVKESDRFLNDNALRKLAYKENGWVGFVKRTFYEPPQLPGDDTAVVGTAGVQGPFGARSQAQ